MDNWIKATGQVPHGEAYFPALAPRGGHAAQMFASSPSGGSESMHLMYLMSITAAQRQPTMFHCTVMVVDRLLVSVGSTNFDNRSFRLNDEANLNVLDAEFAQRQIAIFEQDLQRSKPVTLQAWQARPWREKLVEHAASLLGSQL